MECKAAPLLAILCPAAADFETMLAWDDPGLLVSVLLASRPGVRVLEAGNLGWDDEALLLLAEVGESLWELPSLQGPDTHI